MKSFACRDMGFDCDYVATAESVEEVMTKADSHGAAVHKAAVEEMVKKMTVEELKAAVQSKVKDL
ncbi:MAG: DUF1059 domain-containing protein [bacterium]|nr:DUF1059 domain-containing protein [bacterium]